MRSPRTVIAAVFVLLLTGCGDPLDSRYGVTEPGSINGCAVLHDILKSRTNLRDADVLGPRLKVDGELLVHVARTRAVPDDAACTWIENWLHDQDGRQAVLILRGGNLTGWLCRRWAEQARQEGKRLPGEAAKLEELAKHLEERARTEDEDETFLSKGDTGHSSLFNVKRQAAVVPSAISGLGLSELPVAMRVTGTLSFGNEPEITPDDKTEKSDNDEDKNDGKKNGKKNGKKSAQKKIAPPPEPEDEVEVEPLISLTAQAGAIETGSIEASSGTIPWAVAIPYGDSRLVVVLDALPLLDGAQPDPAARKLLGALVDEVTDFHGTDPHTTWVKHLRVRGAGGPPNPMLAVLTSAPISYISWHFVVFLVVLALAGAAWLGRREAPNETRHDRFSRHVLALATRLRDGRYAAWCARAIARAGLRHRQPPPALLDENEARRWLLSLTDAADDAAAGVTQRRQPIPPPSVSTRGSHDHPASTDS